jgi:hypothetical protein
MANIAQELTSCEERPRKYSIRAVRHCLRENEVENTKYFFPTEIEISYTSDICQLTSLNQCKDAPPDINELFSTRTTNFRLETDEYWSADCDVDGPGYMEDLGQV